MQDLSRTLLNYPLELLRVIANRWDVDLNTRDSREAAARLADAMRQPQRITDVWGRLDESQRQALQTVLGSSGSRMPTAMFTRLFGEIRDMGPERLEREKPYLSPVSAAEALYYRGLIASTFDKSAKGPQAITYVPTDLVSLMPTHKTGYDLSAPPEPLVAIPQPDNIRPADTILVDDLTSFLAFCQLNTVALVPESGVTPEVQKALKNYLLGTASTARIALMIALASGLGIAAETNGAFRPLPNARKWLDLRRSEQVRALADTWQKSTTYNELWYTPGLKAETTGGWQSDPLLARQTVVNFLELVPIDGWWPVDELIAEVKEDEPDFQRPAGDYTSWYIRDAQTGQYLRGFESWDRVDGAVLRFILTGLMNGLGLVDTAQNGAFCRLTAYGRAFAGRADWPVAKTEQPPILIRDNGTVEVPRSASRYDRFQLARFTEWVTTADPFIYRVSADGLDQAVSQNIQAPQIITFLRRGSHDQIPDAVIQMIETWGQAGDGPVTMERLIVLRVPTPELLNTIQSTPGLRRYLSVPLGPTAVAVRENQWNELAAALQAQGILVEVEV